MEATISAIAASAVAAGTAALLAAFRSALLILGEDGLSGAASEGDAGAQALLAAVRDPRLRHPFSLWTAATGLKAVSSLCAGAGALGLLRGIGGLSGAASAAAWSVAFLFGMLGLEHLAGRAAMENPRGVLRAGGGACLAAMRAAAVPARALDRLGRIVFGARYSPEALMDVRFGSEEGILDVIEEGAEHGTIGAAEEKMMEGVLRFGETTVSVAMTPWSRVVSLREGMEKEEIARIAAKSGFSRYPVLSSAGEEVVGILETRALLGADAPFRLESLLARPVYVPESMKLPDLFRQQRRTGGHMAVAIDEHGKLCGVITPHDLVARIVGRIDEGNGSREAPEWEKDGALSVPGATPVSVLREEYGIDVPPSPHYETAAGFAADRLQYLPEGRVTFPACGYRVTVADVERFRIRRLRFEKSPVGEDPAKGPATGTS